MSEHNKLIAKDITKVFSRTELASVFAAVLLNISAGITQSFATPMLPSLRNERILTEDQKAWFVAIMNLAAVFGTILGGYLTDRIGRKGCMLMTSLPYALGWSLLIYGPNFAVLMLGRILTGLGTGIAPVATSLYVAEITSKELRGIYMALMAVSLAFGTMTGYVVSTFLHWRWHWP